MEQRYLDIIRRWLWLIVLATISAAVISFWISNRQPVTYEARARLIIGPGVEGLNPNENDIQTGGLLMQTYAELATTRPVLQTVIDELGLSLTPEQLDKHLTIRPTTETQFLTIVVEDGDPEQAKNVANSLADELVSLSPTGDDESESGAAVVRPKMHKQTAKIEESIAVIEAEILELETELQTTEDTARRSVLDNQLAQERQRLSDDNATLALLYDSLQQAITNQVQIKESAVTAYALPSQVQLSVLLGAMAGLIISIVIALTFEYFDDFTVKSTEHIEGLTGLPTLAGIGDIKDKDKLVTITDPRSPAAEAFRVLRTSIQFSSFDAPNHSILVTSSIPGEGRSTIAANLAVVMAQAGHNVLLIDADLRRPSQQWLFDLPNSLGLTSLLLDYQANKDDEETEELVHNIVQVTREKGLQLLTSGPIPPNPSELLGSAKMKMLLSKLSGQYDFVILDSPAVLLATDAAVLSVHADATLLVAWAGKSRKVHLQQAAEKLHEVNANLLGGVLNGLAAQDVSTQYYHDSQEAAETSAQDRSRSGKKIFLPSMPRFQVRKWLGIPPAEN